MMEKILAPMAGEGAVPGSEAPLPSLHRAGLVVVARTPPPPEKRTFAVVPRRTNWVEGGLSSPPGHPRNGFFRIRSW